MLVSLSKITVINDAVSWGLAPAVAGVRLVCRAIVARAFARICPAVSVWAIPARCVLCVVSLIDLFHCLISSLMTHII